MMNERPNNFRVWDRRHGCHSKRPKVLPPSRDCSHVHRSYSSRHHVGRIPYAGALVHRRRSHTRSESNVEGNVEGNGSNDSFGCLGFPHPDQGLTGSASPTAFRPDLFGADSNAHGAVHPGAPAGAPASAPLRRLSTAAFPDELLLEPSASLDQFARRQRRISRELPQRSIRKHRQSLRKRIYLTLERPNHSRLAYFISLVVFLVIIISTVSFVLESEVCRAPPCVNGALPFEPWADIFYSVEWFSVVVFTVEYCAKVATCADEPRDVWRWMIRMDNVLDLLAWVPFWVIGFCSSPMFAAPRVEDTGTAGTAFLRAVRLIRVFRIFEAAHFTLAIKVFAGALKDSLNALGILVVTMGVAVTLLASIIWMLERVEGSFITDELLIITGRERPSPNVKGIHDMCFGTIPSAAWWVLTTMTTVGYGECYPVTTLGKSVGVVTMFTGVFVLGLPITVLGSNFAKVTEMYEDEAERIATAEANKDNRVDEKELREFLRNKRHEGLLRTDVDLNPSVLFSLYDPDDAGYLTTDAFNTMANEICVTRKDHTQELQARMDQRFERLEWKMQMLLDAFDRACEGQGSTKLTRLSSGSRSRSISICPPRLTTCSSAPSSPRACSSTLNGNTPSLVSCLDAMEC